MGGDEYVCMYVSRVDGLNDGIFECRIDLHARIVE